VTAFLVRSVASEWGKGSVVAVDAGVHLSAIKSILEQTQPADLGQSGGPSLPYTLTTGPFAGLEVPNATADANAAHILQNLIETYLITHPHLDHIAGFVINTAGLPGTRPKRVAGLPSTITALKTHIFNNVIWPNLSDENNGAGLLTYMRLVEGGSPLGEGEGKGYLEMCGGLSIKAWSVSHGHCIERHSHRGSSSTRHGSFDASSMGLGPPQNVASPGRNLAAHTSLPTNIGAILQQHERLQTASPAGRRGSSFSAAPPVDESVCVYDSSVYFIRHGATGREILIFGDVEPDSVSLTPRNRQVWQEAAPRIAAGNLAAIFIECSYDDSRTVDQLFGHLTPRYICEEMTALAEEVVAASQERDRTLPGHGTTTSSDKKRKRLNDDEPLAKRKSTPQPGTPREPPPPKSEISISPRTLNPRRRVNSAASSASDHDLYAQTDLPRPRPLPTHPLRSITTSSDSVDNPQPDLDGQGQSQSQDDDGQLSDLSPTTTMAATPFTIPTSHPYPYPQQQSEQQSQPQQQGQQEEKQGESPSSAAGPGPWPLRDALKGLKVVVIHVKERMSDGPKAGEVILRELEGHEREAGLGVEYVLSRAGGDFFF
jgi:3',5'-cyclic-nucleotide phosphodiesterase